MNKIISFPQRENETNTADVQQDIQAESDQAGSLALVKQRLIDLLLDEGEIPYGLTYKKFIERGTDPRPAERSPGKFIFSVERHRAVAGGRYIKGQPMSSYETYMQELLFDPKSNSISEHQEIHARYDIDIWALATEEAGYAGYPIVSYEEGWTTKRRVELHTWSWSIETSSKEKAKQALEKHLRSMNYEIQFEGLEIGDDMESDYSSQLEDATVEIMLSKLDEAWDDPELI